MTRNYKAVSLAMALVFCLSFMAPLLVAPQAAQAAVTLEALATPTVTSGDAKGLGSVRVIDDNALIASGQRVTVTLLDGDTFTAPNATIFDTTLPLNDGDTNSLDGNVPTIVWHDSFAEIYIGAITTPGNVCAFDLNFGFTGGPTLDLDHSGDVKVGIAINGTILAYTEVVIGKTGTGTTTIKGLGHPSVAAGNDRELGDIQISENIGGALETGATIGLVLPSDIEWAADMENNPGTYFSNSLNGPQVDLGSVDVTEDSSGKSELVFSIATRGSSAGFILISNPLVDIDEDCDNGDINVKMKDEGAADGVGSGTAWIGVKGDYSILCEQAADTVPTIYKGQFGVEPGEILITESTASSLVSDRTITVELPTNCYWSAAPELDLVEGDIGWDADEADLSNSDRKATWTINDASDDASIISVEGGEIAVRADADEGPIDAVIGGSAGAEGTVSIGTVASPLTVTVDPLADIIIGLKNQTAGTITITEAEAGLLMATVNVGDDPDTATVETEEFDGLLVLDCPEGVSWAAEPTIEVTAGDLELDTDNVTRTNESNQLNIPVDESSDATPAVITISDILMTTTRVVPEGTIVIGVRGPAIDEEYYQSWDETRGVAARNVTTFVLANCVTPAPSETVTGQSVIFNLGSTIYTVNGVTKFMDVAPFAQDNRTFVPQRYLGLALGIDEANIVWDAATQTASFTTADGKVATCTVGSNILTFDGVETTMDVKPLVVSDRIFLPARFLVEALGGSVYWDPATPNTVYIQG